MQSTYPRMTGHHLVFIRALLQQDFHRLLRKQNALEEVIQARQ